MEPRDKNGLTEREFLAQYDASKFERPSVTVDIILIHDKSLLLIKRGGHPFIGKLALPGGFLEPDEDAYAAAARELFEETGLKARSLRMLPAATAPDRDPRTRIVTLPFEAKIDSDPALARAGDDAADAGWYDLHVEKSSRADGTLHRITLTPKRGAGGESVSVEVICRADKSGVRADGIYTVLGESPLAGDHAAILAQALDIIS